MIVALYENKLMFLFEILKKKYIEWCANSLAMDKNTGTVRLHLNTNEKNLRIHLWKNL